MVAVSLLVLASASCTGTGTKTSRSATDTLWVTPGARGGDGTSSHPFGTLAQAQRAVRARAHNMHSDVVVNLRDGTYTLTQPLELGAQDSGRNGHRIVWRAVPGAHPVVSGGTVITGWKPPTGPDAIWTTTLPAGVRTRQLYFDGVRAQVAQGPPPTTLTPTPTGYIAGDDTFASWADPTGIELVYPSGPSNWTETRCRVASVHGTTITMVEPCYANSSRRAEGRTLAVSGFGQALSAPKLVANARELVTQPGQWYFDDATHTLGYRPLPGQDMRSVTVVAPVLDALVRGAGTARDPVRNVTFEGITFSYAGWNDPSGPDGYSPVQAGARLTGTDAWQRQGACAGAGTTCPYMAFPLTPGNVAFAHARDVAFRDDTFEHLGGAALALGAGTQDSEVRGNLFRDVSSSALVLGTIDEPEARTADLVRHVEVANNYVTAVGVEYQDAPGIVVGYTQDVSVDNNQIDDVPYSGISIGWGGWAERFPNRSPLATNARGNRIAHNLVFDYMKTTIDGGGIYANGVQGSSLDDGLVIEDNVVMQQHSLSWAIYTDNGSMNMTVRHNAVWDALYLPGAGAVMQGLSPYFSFGGCGGGPIAYEDNFSVMPDPSKGLIAATPACGGHPLDHVTVHGNTVLHAQDDIPADLLAHAGLQAPYRTRLQPDAVPTGLPAWTQYS
jgi:hypothetical protein